MSDPFATVSRRRFLRSSMVVGGGTLTAAAALPPAATAGLAPDPGRAGGGPWLDVRHFGAVGDGRTVDTAALQRAIEAAHRLRGAVVHVPAGTWLSGTLHLRSHVTVHLGPGAVLLASRDDDDFAPLDPLAFDTGSDDETIDFGHALLAGRDLERVVVSGTGVIDMNRRRRFGPKPIALKRCRFATVRDVTIVHSPNYCVSLGGCDDVLVDGVVIRDAYADGIDPDCCRRVRIVNCDVESDDDAVCLKASFLLGARGATEDVVVTNCRMRSPSNCFKLGTESTGDFRHITLSNCVFSGRPLEHQGASRAAEGGGLAILTVDGGTIDGVVVANVVMHDVPAPIFVRLGNRGRDQAPRRPGRLRNVSISGVVALGASGTASIAGLPGHPVERIAIENVRIETTGGASRARGLDVPEQASDYPEVTMYGTLPAFGLYVRHARDVRVRDLAVAVDRPDRRPALVADDVADLHVAGLPAWSASGDAPAIWLHDVRGGLVEGHVAGDETRIALRVTGARTSRVAVVGEAYRAPGSTEVAPEIAPQAVSGLARVEPAATVPPAGVDRARSG